MKKTIPELALEVTDHILDNGFDRNPKLMIAYLTQFLGEHIPSTTADYSSDALCDHGIRFDAECEACDNCSCALCAEGNL